MMSKKTKRILTGVVAILIIVAMVASIALSFGI